MRRTTFPALGLATLYACGSQATAPHAAPSDAGVEASAEGGVPCDASGVSKGPWVLHVDGSTATVRWEACRQVTDAGVTFAPEQGGTKLHAVASASPFVVTSTHTPLSTLAPPDFAGTWFMHDAALTGLSPSTCYRYSLDADPTLAGRFCTARSPGDTVRFLAIGDTNPALGPNTTNVLSHTVPLGFDFTLHGGDIEYYSSLIETYAYWFELMPPLLRAGAFLPAIGNHDSDDQQGEPDDKFEQYTSRLWGGAGFDGDDEKYAFSSGGVWFLTVDTELPIDPTSAQFAWLSSELAKAAASPGYRFSILYLHRPFLTCGDTGDDTAGLTAMQPLFTQYKVPLVIQAHMHGYERFEQPGLTLLTLGGGGGDIGDVNAGSARSYCSTRVASGGFFHAAIVEIDPGKLTGTVIDDSGSTRDAFSHDVP